MRRALCATAVALAFAVGAVLAASAEAGVVWLCEPGAADNPCEIGQDTTVRETGKPDRVITPKTGRRPIDCFYVYPTVSNQPTPNADKSRDPELESIAKYQAARFSTQCRVYAPIYRQGTLLGITGAVAGGESGFDAALAYGDVLEAWHKYLRKDNHGRGVVLIGHSQGSFMLKQLLAEEIEPHAAQRHRIVSALLLGGNVEVPRGKAVGGDFERTPLCTGKLELDCVVAYSTFAEDPPEGSFFGSTATRGRQVGCTDPRKLSGYKQPLRLLSPSEMFAPGAIAAGIVVTSGGPPPTADTTWVTPADRFQGTCRTINGSTVLRYEPEPGSQRPGSFPEPGWGTHLIDVSVTLDPLLELVRGQSRRWTEPSLKLRKSCGHGMRVRIAGADTDLVRKAVFSLGSKRIGRDRNAPFKAHVGKRKLHKSHARRVKAKLRLPAGASRRIVLRLSAC